MISGKMLILENCQKGFEITSRKIILLEDMFWNIGIILLIEIGI